MDVDELRARVQAELPRIRQDLEDLVRIEARMREIIARNEPFTCETWTREAAKAWFAERGVPLRSALNLWCERLLAV